MNDYFKFFLSLATVFLISIFAIACQTSEGSLNNNDENVHLVSRVDSVQVIAVTSEHVTLRTVSTIPNPCHYLHAVEKNIGINQTNVRILTTVDADVACIEILGTLETNIVLNRAGLNQLHVIFPGQIADFDTTLVF